MADLNINNEADNVALEHGDAVFKRPSIILSRSGVEIPELPQPNIVIARTSEEMVALKAAAAALEAARRAQAAADENSALLSVSMIETFLNGGSGVRTNAVRAPKGFTYAGNNILKLL